MSEQTLDMFAPRTSAPARATSRWKASAIHLSISLSVGTAVLLSMLLVWFPQPYLQAAGAVHLFLVLLGVDVSLGPLITLIIFDTKKKRLKLDLAVIAALQVAALVYGLNAMIQARPVYLAFVVDRFELVLAGEIAPEELARASATEFGRLPIAGPKLVAADLPSDSKERERILFSAVDGGADLEDFPQYYVRYEDRKARVRAKALPLAKLKEIKPAKSTLIDDAVKACGLPAGEVAWLPMRAKKEDMTVLLNATTGDVLSVVPVSPW